MQEQRLTESKESVPASWERRLAHADSSGPDEIVKIL